MKTIQKSDLQEALLVCKGAFYSAAGFSMIINFLMLAPVIYMLQLYDRVVPTSNESTLLMLTLIMVALFITSGILEWVRSQILVRVSTRLETLLNTRLFDIAYKQSLFSGGQRASSQPLDDLTALRQFMTGNGLFAFFDAPWMPFYVIVMFIFHPWYGWAAIFTSILLTIIAIINEKATKQTLTDANSLAMSGRALVNNNLRNAEVVESMGMLNNIRQRWQGNSHKVLGLQSSASSKAGMITSLSKTIRQMSQSLILGVGAYLVIQQEITPGLMIAGSVLLGRALAPIDLMIGTWKGFIAARGQYKRLNEVLISWPADEEKMPLPDPEGRLVLENIVVTPPGSKTAVIKGIDLIIEKGDSVAIIGPSGSGKSTLARAMLGIWPVTNGKVRLDGADIFTWDRIELGPHIGYLPQDIELFEGTISENISRFGEVDSTQVVYAAQMADVHEMILKLPEGYDTIIGSPTGMLSGGQKQRIGLARALYGAPKLIVLDEPNSNLDDIGEKALANTLLRLSQQKITTIIITHRNSVLSQIDKLMIINEGVLNAYGPREQVLAAVQQKIKEQAQAMQAQQASTAK
ncbi:MAG: type I secretion system permease/ATPase [Methylococcales bacterium]|nr:type I secretion system permease/ATPase [Methylococcales bacterium]